MKKKEDLRGINESFINQGAQDVKNEDVQKVVDMANTITEKVLKSDSFKRLANDVKLLISMVKDYWSGNYTDVPYRIIAAVVFALLYVLSPIDVIPDLLPVIGMTDDALVVALCLVITEKDILKYNQWKEEQEVS